MIPLEEARERILSKLTPLPAERIAVVDSVGRWSAGGVVAKVDLPGFDNSAMDGYAVRSADLTRATSESPGRLRVVGRIAAGDQGDGVEAGPGECVRVFTGSPLPRGTDSVVMQEETEADPSDPSLLLVREGVKPWENIRLKGEDTRAGAQLLGEGDRVTPGSLGWMAATGVADLLVHRRPRIALIATGNELLEPGAAPAPGCIYESNRATLAAALSSSGAEVLIHPLLPDRKEQITRALSEALSGADLLITTGGVSVGELDLLKEAFESIGGRTEFWKVAMKPGKPFTCGTWNGKLWCGLPGNPVSAYVTFLLLARPAVLRLAGAREVGLVSSWGELTEEVVNAGDRRHFMRVMQDPQGRVRSAGMQASHSLGSLAQANGLLDLAPGTRLVRGTPVQILRFP
ncbi:MAG TPA: molybdopterin molybdenumtransferase MoeA [Verrucomicrobiales bacterium]|nr:molybdopterin molybdenumtransferase MoeA [Verrucomicrobiales bacterium]